MNKLSNSSKRIFYFDALRALAIFAVVMLHVISSFIIILTPGLRGINSIPSIHWFFYETLTLFNFGVPLFFMLTGALVLGKNLPIDVFLKRRFTRIIYPFIFWGLITFLITLFLIKFSSLIVNIDISTPYALLSFLYNYLIAQSDLSLHFWFFWTIFAIYLILPIVNKWILNSSFKEIEYILIVWFVFCLLNYTLSIKLPGMFSNLFASMGFVVLGYYLRFTNRKIFNNIYVALLLIFISIISELILLSFISLNDPAYNFPMYSLFLIMIATGFFILFKNLKLDIPCFIKKIITSMSKHSYGIYLVHYTLLILISSFITRFSLKFRFLIGFIIVFGVSWLIVALVSKIPYLGKLSGSK